jgi:hypothetical protein
LSLLFLFLTIYRIANEFTAWTGVILLATNALALLHTRRAMAEGILLFTSILTMWALVRTEKQRWLISIPATLAFCAKQTLAPLLPIGLVAVLWSAEEVQHSRWKTTGKQALYFSTTVLALLLLMHPFVWSQPLRALQASIQARQSLAARQTADRPEQTLNTTERKLVSMISNLYLNPPVFAETRNYTAETYSSEQAYLTNPLHSLFRSIPAGGTLLVLNLFGFITGILRAIRKKPAAQRRMVLILAATILQTIALFVLIPLPWQRYYLPLIPYTCLWTAFGIDQLRQAIHPTKKTQPL